MTRAQSHLSLLEHVGTSKYLLVRLDRGTVARVVRSVIILEGKHFSGFYLSSAIESCLEVIETFIVFHCARVDLILQLSVDFVDILDWGKWLVWFVMVGH